MIRRFAILTLFAAAAQADSGSPNGLTVTFNGAALEIHTESSQGQSTLSTSGSVSVSDKSQISRTVVDKTDRVLFTYDIEVSLEPSNPPRYNIRIKPHDPNQVNLSYFRFAPGDQVTVGEVHCTVRSDGTISVPQLGDVPAVGHSVDKLADALRRRAAERGVATPGKVTVMSARREAPTVAAVREFRNVRVGEAVSIDILQNPSTGERISDVILALPPGPKFAPLHAVNKVEDEFSLMKIRIAINGKTVQEPDNSWMVGGAIKMSLPSHGTVYLAIQPVTSFAFQPVGLADGKRLTFPIGPDFVEITGADNVMKKVSYRKIWVYWDPAAPNTESVDITCSGTVEAILPKR